MKSFKKAQSTNNYDGLLQLNIADYWWYKTSSSLERETSSIDPVMENVEALKVNKTPTGNDCTLHPTMDNGKIILPKSCSDETVPMLDNGNDNPSKRSSCSTDWNAVSLSKKAKSLTRQDMIPPLLDKKIKAAKNGGQNLLCKKSSKSKSSTSNAQTTRVIHSGVVWNIIETVSTCKLHVDAPIQSLTSISHYYKEGNFLHGTSCIKCKGKIVPKIHKEVKHCRICKEIFEDTTQKTGLDYGYAIWCTDECLGLLTTRRRKKKTSNHDQFMYWAYRPITWRRTSSSLLRMVLF